MKYIWIIILIFFSSISTVGQNRVLEGQVLNIRDSLPLAYSTLHIGKGIIGVVADSTGTFNFKILEKHLNDTLFVSHLGFYDYKIPLKSIKDKIDFYLHENPFELNEIKVVYDKSPPKFATMKEIREGRKLNNSIFYQLSIDDALNKAKDENKLVLLYFGAKWCGPCNWMELHVFNDSTVIDMLKRQFIAVKLDADKISSDKPISTYKIAGYPTFLILETEKMPRKRKLGKLDKSAMINFLEEIPLTSTDSVKLTNDEKRKVVFNRKVRGAFKPQLGATLGTNFIEGVGFNSSIYISMESNRVLIRPSLEYIRVNYDPFATNSLLFVSDLGFTFFKSLFFGLPGGLKAITSFYYGRLGIKNRSLNNESYGVRYGFESYIGDTSKLAFFVIYNNSLKNDALENTQLENDGFMIGVSMTF